MHARRRLVAVFALLAIAWTSLWPLVSAAHARLASEAMPLCHQAGMAVAIDQPGQMPQQPGHPQPRFHCPLCVMAFLGGFSAPPQVEPAAFRCRVAVLATYCAPTPRAIAGLVPPSRAPPAFPQA